MLIRDLWVCRSVTVRAQPLLSEAPDPPQIFLNTTFSPSGSFCFILSCWGPNILIWFPLKLISALKILRWLLILVFFPVAEINAATKSNAGTMEDYRCCLGPGSCSAKLLIQPRFTCPGMASLVVNWDLLNKQKNAHMPTWQTEFFKWDSLFSGIKLATKIR